MSDNAEQITKEPKRNESYIAPKREKDPKRVAAGKELAEKNKRMREEYARLKASEEERQRRHDELRVSEAQRATDSLHEAVESETGGNVGGNLLSQLTLTNVISLVGIGLTVYTIFFKEGRVNKSGEKQEAWQEPVHTTYENTKVPEPKPKPKPKFGM